MSNYSYHRLSLSPHLPTFPSPTPRNRRLFLVVAALLGSLVIVTSGWVLFRKDDSELRGWMEPTPTGYLASTSLSLEGGDRDFLDKHGELREERETKVMGGKEGFYFFHNLYHLNGTFYAISNDPSIFPNTTHITHADPFIVLSPQEATYLFYAGPKETRVVRSELLKGGTLFFSKSGWNGTISPYHWLIEVVMSCYMVFATLSKNSVYPRRMINEGDGWRGAYSDLNEYILDLLAPHTYMRDTPAWEAMKEAGNLWMFDEIVLFDRWAAQETSLDDEGRRWNKVFGGLYEEVAHKVDWFEPLRDLVKEKLGVVDPTRKHQPRVTYINRQITNQRNMLPADHEALVLGLEAVKAIDLTIALLEELTPAEQITLALETDILLGLHGAGFTHMVWMKRGSVLFEVFPSDSFARDYEMISEPLGIRYHSIHNDTVFDWKADGVREIQVGPDFSAHSIPAAAQTLLDLLAQTLEEGGNWSGK
ncbi:hypothetical protein BDY24DRAFT_402171 [Mrakia frigida]|uniref:uncharacterized protein n=1 Tax=Mrakia frigida TaxID=29902 RepID=UPI003FCC0AB4